jgi:hypothetical protein
MTFTEKMETDVKCKLTETFKDFGNFDVIILRNLTVTNENPLEMFADWRCAVRGYSIDPATDDVYAATSGSDTDEIIKNIIEVFRLELVNIRINVNIVTQRRW